MEAERRQRAASMDMADPAAPAKVDTDEVEDLADPANSDSITYKSRFEQLSVWQTLITFRKAVGYTLIVATALMMEGFEVCLPSLASLREGCSHLFPHSERGFPPSIWDNCQQNSNSRPSMGIGLGSYHGELGTVHVHVAVIDRITERGADGVDDLCRFVGSTSRIYP